MRRILSTLVSAALVVSLLAFAATGALAATSFFNGFETNTDGWVIFPGTSPTISRVASGDTSSTYASGAVAATGDYYARLGKQAIPDTCLYGGGVAPIYYGPSTRWGGYESTFPTGGYSTGVDIYLDVDYALANPDTRFDWSSAINNPGGTHRRDFVFNAGTDAAGFVINAGNNSTRCGANPGGAGAVSVTTSGWYTFKHSFTDQGGVLSVNLQLVNKLANTIVGSWVLSDPTDLIGSTVGGHRYGWFVQNEFDGLAIDNSELRSLLPSADLSITKTDSPDPVRVGQNLTYTLAVHNAGPESGAAVEVSDTLPAGVTYVSSSSSTGSCTGTSTVSCSLGTLASGADATVTIVVTTTTTGTLSNTATVSSTTADPSSTNNSSTATTTVSPRSADLSVSKTDSPDPVHIGQKLVYTIIVTNSGPDGATSVSLVDNLPKNAGYGSYTTTQGSCTLKPAKQQVTCSLGDLASGATATVTITVKPTKKGTITNTVTVSALSPTDPDTANNTATQNTTVLP